MATGLRKLTKYFLTMFLGFQLLLCTLFLLYLNVYLQYKIIVRIISSFVSSTKTILKEFSKNYLMFQIKFWISAVVFFFENISLLFVLLQEHEWPKTQVIQ